ncbi:hypothetical protein MWU54_13615 [Marivita sp. S6314]|uniref:hypothetical protein n=1 Tax=Marivita sp. S6314 TaxID=2926406 RepID=UPI001FF3940F|nr:hypothetical protein [Marivita sp. S6314]MCK0151073.1 hypothetical protein [Marivita sp. S6314]
MKPDFALTLSFEGISLLRRVSNGWALVGDVALDAADLRGALAELRTEADTLSPHGGQVKLIVPNEQIKYLKLPDIGQTGDDLQQDIRHALDGATPYAVDDLSFDWATRDGQVFVAAVANETLDEAEAFAKSHHFEPVSFAAIAEDGDFEGEVFFGTAASWTGPTPEKDDHAIVIVPPEQVVEASAEDAPDGAADAEPVVEEDSPEATASDAEHDATIEAEALAPGAADAPVDDDAPEDAASDVPPPAERPVLTPRPAAPAATPSFASIRASRSADTGTAPPPPPAVPLQTDSAAPTPRFKLGGARKSTRDSDVTAPVLQVEPVEDPQERKGFGFFSRRQKAETAATTAETQPPKPEVTPERDAVPPAPAAKPAHDPGPARAAVARIAAMRAGRSTDQPKPNAAELPDERQRMTVFGARAEPQIGGKPRFLGLMLTSALLVLLLAVAAWASVFMDEGISRFFDRSDETPSIARLPDVELQPLDGSVTAPVDEDAVQLAALNVDDAEQPDDTGLASLLPPPAALTPEEADARYAATGIWLKSPDAPAAPSMTSLDDLYVASIDGRVQQFDAVALPSATVLRNDETYLSLSNPPAAGSRYNLDARGLVIATPEGAVNPEGVRIFAGLPPVVPPARPAAPEVAPEPTEEVTTAVSALQQFRPKPRPGGLVESNERATLSGSTRAELAAFRPSARPAALKAAEEDAQPEATKFAVAQSVEPVTRPRNFSRIVSRAREIQQSQETQVTQVAAVAPRTVQPRIPSTANVARQATVKNAINLRRINLIGVYGKPSSRRALVRLSNGRYQKVAVGDRLDGGRVAAIGNSELRYTKNGRNVVLDMPDG